MASGRLVFSQLMDFVPWHVFRRQVARYKGDYRVRRFSCRDQFLCMAYAQLAARESLRDVEISLRAQHQHLYRMGLRGTVARATLADANEQRDYRIHAGLAGALIKQASALYRGEGLGEALRHTVYALDSTIIELCLSLHPWSPFQHNTAAIKVHTQLDLSTAIPTVVRVSRAHMADLGFLDELILQAGAIYVMDRGYLDYRRLDRFCRHGAFFVIRQRRNSKLRPAGANRPDPANRVLGDQPMHFAAPTSRANYPQPIRAVAYREPESGKVYRYLSNNWELPATTIAELYKARWQVELFFKWIKQNLRLRHFLGRSPNAIKSQIWIAIAVYLLIAIAKRRCGSDLSMQSIRQILNVTLFEKTPLVQILNNSTPEDKTTQNHNQLNLIYS